MKTMDIEQHNTFVELSLDVVYILDMDRLSRREGERNGDRSGVACRRKLGIIGNVF